MRSFTKRIGYASDAVRSSRDIAYFRGVYLSWGTWISLYCI